MDIRKSGFDALSRFLVRRIWTVDGLREFLNPEHDIVHRIFGFYMVVNTV